MVKIGTFYEEANFKNLYFHYTEITIVCTFGGFPSLI